MRYLDIRTHICSCSTEPSEYEAATTRLSQIRNKEPEDALSSQRMCQVYLTMQPAPWIVRIEMLMKHMVLQGPGDVMSCAMEARPCLSGQPNMMIDTWTTAGLG